MDRHVDYSYSYTPPVPHKHYPAAQNTSSAFSASANPNEDWTKISDLAERRRIQNRIAQRNYRKKLKKRLEDLERRAASSSASPEQKHEELDRSGLPSQDKASCPGPAKDAINVPRRGHARSPDFLSNAQCQTPPEERNMFSHQYTRQLSTSPPPFSYATYPPMELMPTVSYPSSGTYAAMSAPSSECSSYQMYLPPLLQQSYGNYLPTMGPVKQEFYGDDETSPFSMSYASMAGMDIPNMHVYQEPLAQTPPLLDSFEHSVAGSPPDSTTYPRTPASMPLTPPLQVYERS